MKSICGSDCCESCGKLPECGGCAKTEGKPFGGHCIAAESIKTGGESALNRLKQTLIAEINALGIDGLRVDDLNLLNGFYVNLEYPLPSGQTAKFLNDSNVYFGNQIEREGNDRCYGVVADETMLLVCEYGCMGADPVLLCYKKRETR